MLEGLWRDRLKDLKALAEAEEITLEPVADGTEVRLRHSGLPAGEPPPAHPGLCRLG